MKKLLVTAACLAMLVTQAQADKISDTFKEVEGTWCFRSEIDDGKGPYKSTTYTKPCTKNGDVEWLTIDKVATMSGSEYTCLAVEGGDFRELSVPTGDGTDGKPNTWVKRMQFAFKYRCTGEGHKWTQDVRILLGGVKFKGNPVLFVAVKK
jgi:hypothetical protein